MAAASSLILLVVAVSSLPHCYSQFVKREGQQFKLNGQNFNFGGANNYYIPVKSKPMVDDVFDSAKKMGIPVIRTWAFNVIGNPQGGSSWPPNVQEHFDVYYQYWDSASGQSKVNEGANGIERLDYAVKKARDTGVKLLLVLTNNWGEYGGAEQMNLWYGVTYHDDFFTFDKTKMEYKKWVNYLLNRKNKYTGVAYKDEPAIFAWELINEVRCKGCVDIQTCKGCKQCKPANKACTPDKVTAWVAEMANYVKSIDKNHLVGVGDEGFFYKWSADWAYDGQDGDHESLVKLPQIDFATTHTYPDAWNRPMEWTDKWIDDHISIAKRHSKPFIMEEFGWNYTGSAGDKQDWRNQVYDRWTKKLCDAGSNWMFWMLGGRETNGDSDSLKGKGLYPDYDKYTIYYQTPDEKRTSVGQAMQDRVYRTKTRKC